MIDKQIDDNPQTDIRIIKVLNAFVSEYVYKRDQASKEVFETRWALRKKENTLKVLEEQLKDARDTLETYEPEYEKRLTEDNWKNY